MNPAVTRLWILALIVKLVVSALLPLTPDEAYYWVWSKHLQLSYYDHPAMVAWLMALGEPFQQLGQAVRWPAVLMSHASTWIWLLILKDYLTSRQQLYFLALLLLSPLTGMGSLILTPDLPLLFFWSLSLLCLQQALKTQQLNWYLALGASLGLGFCSKYHIVLFVPILLCWLTFEKQWKQVKLVNALACVLVGLLFCFPVLYWNWQNNFVSFRFQIHHGLGQKSWNPNWTISYVTGQIGLIFPLVLYVLLRRPLQFKSHLLFYFGWGPLLFFGFTSTRGFVEANWPATGYPALMGLATLLAPHLRAGFQLLKISIGIWATVLIGALVAPLTPLIDLEKISDRLAVMQEYRRLAKLVPEAQPLYAGNYQLASVLSFETKTMVYKARGYSRRDFFDELPQSIPSEKKFFVVIEKEQRLPENLVAMGYRPVTRTKVDRHHFLIEVQRD